MGHPSLISGKLDELPRACDVSSHTGGYMTDPEQHLLLGRSRCVIDPGPVASRLSTGSAETHGRIDTVWRPQTHMDHSPARQDCARTGGRECRFAGGGRQDDSSADTNA